MKKMLLGFVLFFLGSLQVTVYPPQITLAEALAADPIELIRRGGAGWSCIKIKDAVETLVSSHNDQHKATQSCMAEKVRDIEAKLPGFIYVLRPIGDIEIIFNAAAAQITMPLTTCADGSMNTEYPDGTCPVGGITACSTLTYFGKGDADGEVDEVSSTAYTVYASGSSDVDNQDGCYGTIGSSGDIQILARVVSIDGHTENFTGGGVGITESLSAGQWFAHSWYPSVGGDRCKYGTTGGGLTSVTGTTAALPRWYGYVYDVSETENYCIASSDGSTWETITSWDEALSFPAYYYPWATSHDAAESTTVVIDNFSYSSTISAIDVGDPPPPPPPPTARQVDWSASFEAGVIAARSSGASDASFTVSQTTSVGGKTCNITGISRSNPAVITYTGCTLSNGEGLTIRNAGGMTQANDQLVRVSSVGGGSFSAKADNFPAYTAMPASQALGTFNFNTSAYSVYTSGGTLQGWQVLDDAGGGYGPATAYESKIVNSGSATVGGDTNVDCRNGSYCFRNVITYHAANLSNNKNKPRGTERPANTAQIPHNKPFYLGISIYAPSDLCSDNSNQENMIMSMSADSASQDFLHLMKRGGSDDGVPNWYLEWGKNASSPNQSIDEVLDLGNIERGVWTDWVIYGNINPTSGTLRVFRNVEGSPPVELTNGALPITGTGFGNQSAGGDNQWTIRQYAFTWHHQASSCTDATQEILFDDVYIGLVENGTDFSDVHAARASQP